MFRVPAVVAVLAAVVLAAGAAFAFNTQPLIVKGRAYLDGERAVIAKDYAKALPLLLASLKDEPDDPDAHNLIGYSKRKLGDRPGALASYLRALEIDPQHLGANAYLGELYVELKELPKAEERLERLRHLCAPFCEEYRDLKAVVDRARAGS